MNKDRNIRKIECNSISSRKGIAVWKGYNIL